jgi:ubiquitin-like 1-activating enzyme E1 B
LDTIEVSNLNRQFYFRKVHVGRSKAEVAAEILSKLNKNLEIQARHSNIMSAEFNIDFYTGFDMVLLALDN